MLPGDRPHCFDVGITSPFRTSILPQAARISGFAASQYEDTKNTKYRSVGASYYTHVPLIQENSGRLGNAAWQTLKKIAAYASAEWATTKSAFIANALGMLSVSNVRATYILV